MAQRQVSFFSLRRYNATMAMPLVGITVDRHNSTPTSERYQLSTAYSCAVSEAGGLPVLLVHDPALATAYVDRCDAVVLTGGDDPRTEAFGEPTHPKARPMDMRRQAFEVALLEACDRRPKKCVLGICLGMQLIALHHGGRLCQYLPDEMETAQMHAVGQAHPIVLMARDSVLCSQRTGIESAVISRHRQAVREAGTLRVVAQAADGVIEAIDDPTRRFYLGVQWHPELGDHSPSNRGLFGRLLAACGGAPRGAGNVPLAT